jgi:hypothetical protein
MKLTNQQIAKIEETLIEKGIVYDDIKLELIDHIASEIELENEESNFDTAFSKVMAKWEESLKKTSSIWSADVAPRVVFEKFSSLSKRQFKFSLLSVVVFSVLITTITTLNTQEYIYNALKLIFTSAYFLVCLTIITCLFFTWKLKSKTIYGRFFQKNSGLLVFHFYIIYTFFNGHTHLYRHYDRDSFIQNFFEWFRSGFFFFMAVYLVIVAKEHFKTTKKYKLI